MSIKPVARNKESSLTYRELGEQIDVFIVANIDT